MDVNKIKVAAFRFSETGARNELGYFINAINTSELDEFRRQVAEEGGAIISMSESWTATGDLCVLVGYTLPEERH